MNDHYKHLQKMAVVAANEEEDALLWALGEIERLQNLQRSEALIAMDKEAKMENEIEELQSQIKYLITELTIAKQKLYEITKLAS